MTNGVFNDGHDKPNVKQWTLLTDCLKLGLTSQVFKR